MKLEQLNEKIPLPDQAALQQARTRWDSIAKPLNGLGLLEEAVVRIAGLTGSADVRLQKRGVLVFCADNGVVEEGVTQTDSSVTAVVAQNMTKGSACVCRMAQMARADVMVVDIGMQKRVPGTRNCAVADGTRNFTKESAMTREQAETAIEAGMALVKECREKGYDILVTGEMGIGNTTTASAMASVLLNIPVEEATGRGAGLSDAGLQAKRDAIRRGILQNRPDCSDALDVLSKLGGFDIAGMTGMFLGGALYRIPIVIDGMISSVAALTAARLCPHARCAMLASHVSGEPAAQKVLSALKLPALLHGEMRLGEGTGGVCLLPLLDLALAVYHGMPTYDQIGIEAYVPQGGDGV